MEKEKAGTGKSRVKKKISKRITGMAVTLLCSVAFSLLAGLFLYLQERRYEDGILDICAVQQDGYVQLVLDQINLEQNRNDEQIISEILSTLDASSNKYWTFSKDQSMLFVKDVLETNKYKGFTTASYYASESSTEFLESLRENQVRHAAILVNNREYIASGAAFQYRGSLYRLCLLTNRSVLLDNNRFLGAKSETYIAVGVILFLLVVVSCAFAIKVRSLKLADDKNKRVIAEMSRSITNLDAFLSQRDLHDTRTNTWDAAALPEFLDKLKKRGAFPLVVAKISCESGEGKALLLRRASLLLDRTVLRFEGAGNEITFLFVQCRSDTAQAALEPLVSGKAKCTSAQVIEDGRDPIFEPEKETAEREEDECQ